MWMADDFSSHLFLTTFFQFMSEGVHPSSALQKTAVWLREIKASDVLQMARAALQCLLSR
jgi:CHAT domain-containing protein